MGALRNAVAWQELLYEALKIENSSFFILHSADPFHLRSRN